MKQLTGSTSHQKASVEKMLLTPQEEKAIVRWIFKLDEWGFPPRLEHVKKAIVLLKYGAESAESYEDKIGQHYSM